MSGVRSVRQYLGLGQRAGQVVSGDFVVRVKLRKREAYLVIVASDAAASTAKDIERLAKHASVPVVRFGTKMELGSALGRSPRAVVAVLNKPLADRILEILGGKKDE
ncbi:L7Ae/L30e/S12e/Gadd45 family ribosomal protein [Ammonifex thiophilus]|uniref:50S ribosomal protein L7 n=1 Tax=Ammonifex thiophilus TaxID=444093 RepID=A0A3D8P3X9_9THEO|nr:ribosomal L7Ae/L30e/S12e/Gadd45 family protein [Ammonifex thiophilus]RDV82516.1 50S ribosomal protein L7 [Ammonifex thiophilus]